MLLGIVANAEELAIQFQGDPPFAVLRPFSDVVRLSLRVTAAGGKPVERGEAAIVLDAPERGVFLTTDFPLVEGTRLLEARLPLHQGRTEWQQLLPIRGVYRLSVVVTAGDGSVGRQIFEFSVVENREKWLWLGLLCAGLFFVGFIAGRIFTPDRTVKAVLIIALFVAASEFAAAHEAAKAAPQDSMAGTIEVDPATVGKPTRIRWRGSLDLDQPALLSLAIVHLEKDKTVLAFDKLMVERELSFNFHFPDGAEYSIKTVAQAAGRAAERAEQRVSVTGVEPSFTTQLPSLALFVGVIAVGLAAGRFSKRR